MIRTLAIFISTFILSFNLYSQEYLLMIESGNHTIQEIQINAEKYFSTTDKGKGTGYKQYKRWEYNALRMADENGRLKSDSHYLREWEKLNADLNQSETYLTRNNDFWTEMGPDYYNSTTSWNPGIGRITSFHIDAKNEKHIIAGAETGGIWKTTDGAVSWQPMTDFFSNIAVESVVMDPKNANIYFFGSNNGKIFQSTDAGNTWKELSIAGASKVKRLRVHPDNSNIMYASTQNSGFFKSINAGASWTKVAEDNSGYDIQFKPNDPNTVYLSGSSFHVSRDGGNNFRRIYDGEGNADLITITSPSALAKGLNAVENSFQPGYVSVPVYPSAISGKLVLYKDKSASTNDACGEAENQTEILNNIVVVRRGNCVFVNKVLNAQNYGAKAVIVINNVDGGPTNMGGGNGSITIPALMISKAEGDKLLNDMLSNDINVVLQKSYLPPNSMKLSPKVIGVSPSDPNTVYVLEADRNVFGGLYKSTDAGESFIKLNHAGKNYFGYSTLADDDRGQAPRNMAIAVHPQNANEVHIGGILTFLSTDGGLSFNPTSDWVPGRAFSDGIGYCHADICEMKFYSNKLYVSSDGGLFKAQNTQTVSESYFEDITEGLGVRQFYKIGISQTNPITITGGSQDNGSSWYSDEFGWLDWLGADGMECFVDKDNRFILYGTTQNGGLYRKDQFDFINSIDRPENKTGNWVTPFEQDPSQPNTIYTGYDTVFKSTDSGESWTPISQVFSQNLNHLKIAKTNNKIMFAAHGASLFKTTTGGGTWLQQSGFSGSINEIAIHPKDPQKIAIATTSSQKVFISYDGGSSWTGFRKNLPDFSALSLVWDERTEEGLYVGMNYGIFYINKSMQNWIPFLNNLPNVIINELEINHAEGKLYAATYGRGLWVSPLYEATSSTSALPSEQILTIQPNPASEQIIITSPNIENSSVTIFNAEGKLMMYQKNINLAQHAVNVTDFPAGLYYIRANHKKGENTVKFIKL